MISEELLRSTLTNKGDSLSELSRKQPVLLIFLRHFGCIFCREAMKDIQQAKNDVKQKGVKIILAHLSDQKTAEEYFEEYGIGDLDYISDPECKVYDAFGLIKGNYSQLFGLKVLLRSAQSAVIEGNFPALKYIGDGFQMPGIFLIENGQVRDSYLHKSISDRPDYQALVQCCSIDKV